MARTPVLILLASMGVMSAAGVEPIVREHMNNAEIRGAPAMTRPDYLSPVNDPVFGTRVVRVTDPGHELILGMSCDFKYCRHRYSSTQAWNADQSLLAITNGCNGMCFLDGRTYKPLFHRGVSDDCKWDPVDATSMICVTRTRIYRWRPKTNNVDSIFVPGDYTSLEFGPYKGNLSFDGSRLALRAVDDHGRLVVFAYDLARKLKFPDVDLTKIAGVNTSCGISPSGQFFVCFQLEIDKTETAYVFGVGGNLVDAWPEHHRPAHGDMTIDADGSDVYIGISKADPDKWRIIKRRLIDGVVTALSPPGYATHVSTRCIKRPGWAIASFEGTFEKVSGSRGWAPFYQEVVAVRLDGSGEIRRIAHTYNARVDYYSESQASPSPDASRIVWSSNWGEKGGPIADYVAEATWPETATEKSQLFH